MLKEEGAMTAIDERMNLTYRMSNVERLAGTPKLMPYSLSMHCLNTAILFKELADLYAIPITTDQLLFVMRHDIPEVLTGDVLWPAKNKSIDVACAWGGIEHEVLKGTVIEQYGEYRAYELFDASSWALFRQCDTYELLLFVEREMKLGNSTDEIKSVRKVALTILGDSQFLFFCNAVAKRKML